MIGRLIFLFTSRLFILLIFDLLFTSFWCLVGWSSGAFNKFLSGLCSFLVMAPSSGFAFFWIIFSCNSVP